MKEPRRQEADAAAQPRPAALDPWELKPVIRDPKIMGRMRTTFDLFETAVRMQRQNLRRRDPDASDEEIARRLREWLHHRPGAEHGDASGPDFRVTSRLDYLMDDPSPDEPAGASP
jgi:Rv0078B-related antitoxin